MGHQAAFSAFCSYFLLVFRKHDLAKSSIQIVLGTSGEEKVILRAIGSGSAAKLNAPELVDGDLFSVGVFERSDQLPGFKIEAVDGSTVGVVRNQQGIA